MTTLATPSSSTAAAVTPELVVRCVGLTKVFKDFWLRPRVKAVDGIDIDIRRGEVFGLLGPNGSGKSTTIKMILGLLRPTSGRLAVFGKVPDDVATKRLIGYLPEESYLYRFLNARETLDYYGRLFHQDRVQRRRRIDMLLEMVGLEAAQRRPVGEYSKGMQRRIGLAQALINDPQLLILDEPTTGLDPIGTRQIKDLILELARRGKTVLLCSHLLSDVEDVCDRVAIMFGGKVRAAGTIGELLAKGGQTTLLTPELDVTTIEAIDDLLRRQGKAITSVEQPRQKLEELFLEIVHKAQTEGATTSGARSGGRLAAFLVSDAEQRGGHMPESTDPRALIERLTGGATAGPEAASPPKPAIPPPLPSGSLTPASNVPAGEASPAPMPPPPMMAPPTGPSVTGPDSTAADLEAIRNLIQHAGPSTTKSPAVSHPAEPPAEPPPEWAPDSSPGSRPQSTTTAPPERHSEAVRPPEPAPRVMPPISSSTPKSASSDTIADGGAGGVEGGGGELSSMFGSVPEFRGEDADEPAGGSSRPGGSSTDPAEGRSAKAGEKPDDAFIRALLDAKPEGEEKGRAG